MRQAVILAATTAGLIICVAGAANAFERSPQWSDDNLRHIRTNLEWIVDSLQNDRRDYNGHRIAAIGDSQQAREAITDAIAYDNAQENVPNPNFSTQVASDLRSGQGSDANLVRMRQVLERDIDMLQHDQEDYNGNRVRAINYMQQTRTEIVAALQADQGH